MSDRTSAVFYVQLEPVWTVSGRLHSVKATRLWQRRPTQTSGPVARLRLTLPESAFHPINLAVDVAESDLDYSSVISIEEPGETS